MHWFTLTLSRAQFVWIIDSEAISQLGSQTFHFTTVIIAK